MCCKFAVIFVQTVPLRMVNYMSVFASPAPSLALKSKIKLYGVIQLFGAINSK